MADDLTIKTEVICVIEKGDNVYRFSMPVGAPFGEAYDAAFDVLEKVQGLAHDAVKNVRDAREKGGAQDAESSEEDSCSSTGCADSSQDGHGEEDGCEECGYKYQSESDA